MAWPQVLILSTTSLVGAWMGNMSFPVSIRVRHPYLDKLLTVI